VWRIGYRPLKTEVKQIAKTRICLRLAVLHPSIDIKTIDLAAYDYYHSPSFRQFGNWPASVSFIIPKDQVRWKLAHSRALNRDQEEL